MKTDINNIIFSELKVGDVFTFSKKRYMKTDELTDTNFLDLMNAIMLDKNVHDEEHEHPYCYFDGSESVIFISNITDLINAKSRVIKYTIPLDTAVDTKVLVSDDYKEWYPRHFLKIDDTNLDFPYLCFPDGLTSWTSNEDIVCNWKYCRLASEDKGE